MSMNEDLEELKKLYPDHELINVTNSKRLNINYEKDISDEMVFVETGGWLGQKIGNIRYYVPFFFRPKAVFYAERKSNPRELFIYFLPEDTIDNFKEGKLMSKNEPHHICVDFDGTIATYDHYEFGKFGEPIHDVIAKIHELYYDREFKIFIQTTRSWAEYGKLKKWLIAHSVPYEGIIMGGKPIAEVYIDDRGVNPTKFGWEDELEKILARRLKIGVDRRKL